MNSNILNPTEQQIVEYIVSKDGVGTEQKLALINKKSKVLKESSKIYVLECINKIKKDLNKDIKENVIKSFELEEHVNMLLEKETPETICKIPDLKYLRKIKVITLEDTQAPKTVFVKFKLMFYPLSETNSELNLELNEIKKKFKNMGTNIMNQIIIWQKSKHPNFKGTGIWDGDVATMLVRPGESVQASAEWALDINQDGTKDAFSLKESIIAVLSDLETLTERYFGTDLLTPHVVNVKKKERKTKDVNNDTDDKWYKTDKEFDVKEKEPSLKDLERIEKGLKTESVSGEDIFEKYDSTDANGPAFEIMIDELIKEASDRIVDAIDQIDFYENGEEHVLRREVRKLWKDKINSWK